jgi:hypothetical protein
MTVILHLSPRIGTVALHVDMGSGRGESQHLPRTDGYAQAATGATVTIDFGQSLFVDIQGAKRAMLYAAAQPQATSGASFGAKGEFLRRTTIL